MKRYSLLWWLAILPTSVVVGVPTFLLLGQQTSWVVWERIAVSLVCALFVDLAVAAWAESTAPTKVSIGPGERETDSEAVTEKAIVVSGFESSSQGQVAVRGETWSAIRCANDSSTLAPGMLVRVVDRIGLRLVVSASVN